MGAAIRTPVEIQAIINKSQHALASVGFDVISERKQGLDNTDVDHRDKEYRMTLLRIYLKNILLPDGTIKAYYTSSVNEKKFNRILDGLVALSKGFDGPAIGLLGRRNIPLIFYPGSSASPSGSPGGGPASPGGTVFQGIGNNPSTTIDTFNANLSSFAFYVVSVGGTNSGEGIRTSLITATWRGATAPVFNEIKTEDDGGITSPVTLKVEMVGGMIQLNAYCTTSGWNISGLRILFQNISFVNPIGPLPAGGTTNQLLTKSSNADYATQWVTLVASLITDLTASATELNYNQGVTSSVQTQINTINTAITNLSNALANYLLKTGGTMTGNIAMSGNKVTGLAAATSNGDAVRYEQLINQYLLLTGGTLSGPINMGGQKISNLATATLASDAVRLDQVLPPLILNIGDWNIQASNIISFAHGIADFTKIRSIQLVIRNDSNTNYYFDAQTTGAALNYADSTNMHLSVDSFFQTTSFKNTGYNRGYVVITLLP